MTNASAQTVNIPVGAAAFTAPFKIADGPVQQILSNYMMKIPEIQRPYAWKLDNAKELVRDLQKLETARLAGKPQPQHYLGTLVVVTYAGAPDEIVDGQQRLTTVSVLIGQIIRALETLANRASTKAHENAHNVAVEQSFKNIEQNARNQITILSNLVQVPSGIDPNTQKQLFRPRMIVSPEITETYSDLIAGGDGSSAERNERKQPANDLRHIADFLFKDFVTGRGFEKKAEADQFKHLEIRANQVTLGLIWVRLSTDNANSAAELFESLNARGRPLNVLGLIKVWLLGTLKEVNAPSPVISQVSSDFRSLSDDDDEIAVRFFTDFYRIRSHEDVKKNISPKDLSLLAREKVFKDPVLQKNPGHQVPVNQLGQHIADEISYMKKLWPTWERLNKGSDSVAPNMRTLNRLPDICSATQHPAWVNSRLSLLLDQQWLKHQLAYPFLTAVSDHLAEIHRLDQFEELLHDLEKFFFRAKSICGVSPSLISKFYYKQLELIKYRSFNFSNMKIELQQMLDVHADDAKFKQKLIQECVYGSGTNLTKYFLSMIDTYDHAQPPAGPKKPMTPQRSHNLLKLSEWQIEHIVPQRPPDGAHALTPETVNNLGNLCLLTSDWNGHLTNSDYPTKRQKVDTRIKSGHNLPVVNTRNVFTNPAFANTEWTLSHCSNREDELAKRAVEIFVI
jgi:hypothetical protein